MKTFRYFLVLLTFVVFVSCSNDDDTPSIDQSMAVGEWNLEEYTYSGSTTVSQGGTTNSTSYVGEFYDIDARLTLNSDNTYRSEGSYNLELSYTLGGETITQDMPTSNFESTGTYTIQGNRILTDAEQPPLEQPGQLTIEISEGTIEELTSNRMVLVFDEVYDSDAQGMQMNITVEGRQVYSR